MKSSRTSGGVLSKVTLGVTVVGGLVLFIGALILVGSVSMTRFQRIYEVAIFRTLGAGTRLLVAMTALEYGVLGLLAGGIGSASAIGLACYVSRQALDIPWAPQLVDPAGWVGHDGGSRVRGRAAVERGHPPPPPPGRAAFGIAQPRGHSAAT